MSRKVAVLGAGSWGTALSLVLADNDHKVVLWSHRKEQVEEINQTRENPKYLQAEIPMNIHATNDIQKAIQDCDYIVIVVPTKAIREVARLIKPFLTNDVTIVHASKGIEPGTFKRVSEMIHEELQDYSYENLVVLSGPSHAEEVARRDPTTVTVSSVNVKRAKLIQDLFINENFRVYTSDDMVGIELEGALKNIIALGTGISDDLGYGDNAKAALITRRLAEIARLATSLGANPLTFLGLPGVGYLVVTCTSTHSRNWRAGHLLGQGKQLDDVLNEMGMVVEGVRTTKAAYELAKQQNIDMPITTGIYQLLFEGKSPEEIAEHLMIRSRKSELEGFAKLLEMPN